MKLEDILLIIAGTLVALIAGLFFGFSVAVNRGLHRLKDSEYLAAMQSINEVIQNPLFFSQLHRTSSVLTLDNLYA